jgi:hypothetical protein
MATAHRRESMIALRATHQAFRIACDIGHEHIDVDRVTCSACGEEVDWRQHGIGNVVICPTCNAASDLPVHLRGRLLPPPDDDFLAPMVPVRLPLWAQIAWLILIAIAFVMLYVAGYMYVIPNL